MSAIAMTSDVYDVLPRSDDRDHRSLVLSIVCWACAAVAISAAIARPFMSSASGDRVEVSSI